jgi:hypothetical protein
MSADREALSRALGNLLDNAVKYSPEAAKKVESVDGDLKGAIERYKTLAQNNDRAVAAKALLRGWAPPTKNLAWTTRRTRMSAWCGSSPARPGVRRRLARV